MTSTHLIRVSVDNLFTAWCGHEQHSNYRMTSDPRLMNCSKCSSKYYGEQVKVAGFPIRLSDRLARGLDRRLSGYRSVYQIIRNADNEVIGFLTIGQGWGKSWHVHAWEAPGIPLSTLNQATPDPIMAYESVKYLRAPDSQTEHRVSFNSKEEALFAAVRMVEQDKLPGRMAIIQQTTDEMAKLRVQMTADSERRSKANQERNERRDLVREQFAAMLATNKLSNLETMAITTAAEMLEIKL